MKNCLARKHIYRFFVVTTIFMFAAKCSLAQAQRPNIIFILSDDIGYEVPTVNGGQSYTTPNIDFLGEQGMRFTQCHATPLCSPSRFMIMTGKYNFRNYRQWGIMDSTQRTFGNMFRDAGYKTAVYGKWQMDGGDRSVRNFGFDDYLLWDPNRNEQEQRYKSPRLYQNGAYIADSLTLNKYSEDIICDSLLHYIEKNKENPFFIYYPMVLCHVPQSPTPEDTAFAGWNPNLNITDTQFFPSMVKYMDGKVGLIINKVKELGLEDNTIIIFSGDNGTSRKIFSDFDDSTILGGKTQTTEIGTHVPLMVYWKGKITPGSINDDLIDFTDFFPTLADLGHIPLPTNYGALDGVDFGQRLTGGAGNPRSYVFCHFDPNPASKDMSRWAQDKNYKLYDSITTTNKKGQFFRFSSDLNENTPLNVANLTGEEQLIRQNLLNVLQYYKDLPLFLNPIILNITDSSVTLTSNLKSNGGDQLTNRGVVWSTSPNPVIETSSHSSQGTIVKAFQTTIKGLKPFTTYYLRSYATNSKGTAYSNQITFGTSGIIPAPTAVPATDVDSASFIANWTEVDSTNGYQLDVSKNPAFCIITPGNIAQGFDQGLTTPGWVFATGLQLSTQPGKYGISSPSIKFSGTGETITSPIIGGIPTQLKFWMRGLSISNPSALVVQGFCNGIWMRIDSIINISNNAVFKTYNNLNNNAFAQFKFTKFRFIFYQGAGYVAIDDISIDYNIVTPDVLAGYDSLQVTGNSLKITGLEAGTTYYYRLRSIRDIFTSPNSNVQAVHTCFRPSINVNVTNISCNGNSNGAIAINCFDSSQTISYSWSGPNGFVSTAQNIDSLEKGSYYLHFTANGACASDTIFEITEPEKLSVKKSQSEISCNGGNANVVVSANGGAIPYSGTGTFLQKAGSQIYQVTDANGCTDSIMVTLSEPTAITITESHTPILCAGGSSIVTITGNGGTGALTGTGNFVQIAGDANYEVTDSNGCSSLIDINIAEPSAISLEETHTEILCNGGTSTVTLTANGGTAPYAGTGDFLQNSGNQTYSVSDTNGCMASLNINIQEPLQLSLSETHLPIGCNGGSTEVNIVASGGKAPYIGAGKFDQYAGTHIYTVTDANGCTASIEVNLDEPEILRAMESHTDITENGGFSTVTISGTGGTQEYTGTGIFNQMAGTAVYHISDMNGCSASVSVTVASPNGLELAESHTPISCNGGTSNVTISAIGGKSPYIGTGDFQQSSEDSIYIVTDADGNSAFIEVSLIMPTEIILSETHSPILCKNGSSTITISAVGGVAPYSGVGNYLEPAGTHEYSVSDANGCISSIEVNITEPNALVISENHTNIVCHGGTSIVTINAEGGQMPYSGTGDFAQSADSTTYYVTDANGCISSIGVSTSEPDSLIITQSHTAILCNGGNSIVTINATGGTGPYSGTGDFTQGVGDATYVVTDANGCSSSIKLNLAEPAPLSLSEEHTNINCNGNSTIVTINAMGGTGPYTGTGNYSQYSGIKTYAVTDSNGCTATIDVMINEPAPLTVSETHTQINCQTDSSTVILSASGGSGVYTGVGNFLQSPGSKNYIISDENGCQSSINVDINAIYPVNSPIGINNSTCGSGKVTINATCGDNETIDWYASADGGISLKTGTTSYTTPSLTGTTTYYAEARHLVAGCKSITRTPVIAIINNLPNAPTGVDGSVCASGKVTISAIPANNETIDWYYGETSGTPFLSSANSYITSSLTSSKTYYALARNIITGCKSATRTAVNAIVNTLPNAPTIQGNFYVCNTGSTVLSALVSPGETTDWYSGANNGILLQTGANDYVTPVINTTTSYYASARNITTGCISAVRTGGTVYTKPVITANSATSFCDGGSVTLSSNIAIGNQWKKDGTIINGAKSQTYIATKAGTYTVTNTNNDGCKSNSSGIVVTVNNCAKDAIAYNAGTKTIKNQNDFVLLVKPNPSNKEFNLTVTGNSKSAIEIYVTTIYGKEIYSARGSIDNTYKFGEEFAAGTYILHVMQGTYVKTIKIIKGN